MERSAASPPIRRITSSPPWFNLHEIVAYRETLLFLAWLNVSIKYRQTFIGLAWVVVQPVVLTIMMLVIFRSVGKVPSEGAPYPVFALAGLIPWGVITMAMNTGGQSLLSNAALVKRVFIPRILIPLAVVVAGAVDLAVGMVIIGVVMAIYGVAPPVEILLYLPAAIIMLAVAAAGAALWLSAISVSYRDVTAALPFVTQILLFATPIGYPVESVRESLRWVFGINPFTGVIELFRAALISTASFDQMVVFMSVGVALVMFVSGLFVFGKVQQNAADKL